MKMDGRCCVFQPFDHGAHDRRFDDTIAPAIKAADLEPYRVDRDDGAVIPIDTLHEEIRGATICLADVTTRNPNVMYEVGFAIAAGKDVVLICLRSPSTVFPFDIQHRGMIQYSLDSASDFERLKQDITNRIKAILRKQVTTQVVSASPVKSTEGLQPNEVAALALVMANVDSSTDMVSTVTIKQDMLKAGFTKLATQLALTRLARMRLVEAREDTDYNGNSFMAYQILEEGENWLLDNQDKLELQVPPKMPRNRIISDDIPF